MKQTYYRNGDRFDVEFTINGVNVNINNLDYDLRYRFQEFFSVYAGSFPVDLKMNGDLIQISSFEYIDEDEDSEAEDEEEYFNK